MRPLLLAALGLVLAAPAFAQQTDPGLSGAAAQANLNALTAGAPTVVPRGTSEGVKGSPYADSRWRMAQITLSNRVPLAPVPIKYDVLGSRLLMRKAAPSLDSLQLDDRLVQQFVLLNPSTGGQAARPQLFRRFAEAPEGADRTSYVEVLHQGKYTLLKRHRRTLKKATLQGAYSSGSQYDEIEDHSDYFLGTANAPAQPVKLALKPLQQAAPALAEALKTAAAAQHPRTDADWSLVLDLADPAAAK